MAGGLYTWETDLCSTYLSLNTEGYAKDVLYQFLVSGEQGGKEPGFLSLGSHGKWNFFLKNAEECSLHAGDIYSNFMFQWGYNNLGDLGEAVVGSAAHNYSTIFWH